MNNMLTGAQNERLAILSEECGEVIQVIGKIQRHGFDSSSPNRHPLGEDTNRILLRNEILDVLTASSLFENDLKMTENSHSNTIYMKEKIKRLNKYMHYEENKIEE